MRPIAPALALLAAACAAPSAAPPATASPHATEAAAGGPVAVWRGTIRCEPIPGAAYRTLVQPLEVEVSGNQATFTRIVRRGDTGGDSENSERASGTVAPDGSVTLSGSVSSPAYRYASTYEGRLPPNGDRARFEGVQHWTARTINAFDRHCTITLRRRSG